MIVHLKGGFTVTNIVSAAAALSLAASPWLAGFTGDPIAGGNAVLCGLLMLVFTVAALFQLQDWRSWMNLIPGVWVLLSPWILGFATHVVASAIHVIIGRGLTQYWQVHQQPARGTPARAVDLTGLSSANWRYDLWCPESRNRRGSC